MCKTNNIDLVQQIRLQKKCSLRENNKKKLNYTVNKNIR